MDKTERRKYPALTRLLVTFIILLLCVIGYLLFRLNSQMPSPPPHKAPRPHKPREIKTIAGTVTGYACNVHLDINALTLKTASRGVLKFEFRPHTASAVSGAGPVGSEVQVDYAANPDDESITYRLARIKNPAAGKLVDVDDLPPPPRIPPGQQAQTYRVLSPVIITDGYGGIAGLQDKGKLFHFRPGQVEDIQPLIKNCRDFIIQAVKRGDDQGFVNINHDEVYIVISLTMDDKTFMIR